MAELTRKGAGYSIEAVLSAVILFTFAFGAVQIPQQKDWSSFQDEIAARDLSFTLKKTGNINNILRNSNPEAITSAATAISGENLRISGTVENLPLNELNLGFHTMPSEIHRNFSEPMQTGDRCNGDLAEISSNSEHPVLKTNASQLLENRHGVRLYFGDTDARIPGGYNGQVDYDALWVDNGTRCVFSPSEGPYMTDEIFMWGNTTDTDDETYYEFKSFNNSRKSFTVFKADQAAQFKRELRKPVNGIETDTTVDTFNFSSSERTSFNVVIFQKNNSLDRIDAYESRFRNLLRNSSVLFLMNLSQSDVNRDFMKDIGFAWMDAGYTMNPSSYEATFSDYSTSDEVRSYFQGLGGSVEDLTLSPGGKVISSQGSTRTSRNDILYARNTAFQVNDLDGVRSGGEVFIGSGCTETRADYSFPGPDHRVEIVDLGSSTPTPCGNRRAVRVETATGWKGPFLENELLTVNNRTYLPEIIDEDEATLRFAGSGKVELINHRKVLEDIQGRRAARAAFQTNYSESDIKMLSSVIYWLRGDQVQFQTAGSEQSTLITPVIGGIKQEVFLPYKAELRWSS